MPGRVRIVVGVILLVAGTLLLVAGGFAVAGAAYVDERVDEERETNPLTLFSSEDERYERGSREAQVAGGLALAAGAVTGTLGALLVLAGRRAARRVP